MKEYRDWQKNLFTEWYKTGFYGCVKARTGAGKTLAGISVIDQYRQMNPTMSIMVVVPSKKIAEGWEASFDEQMVERVPIMSYTQAINKMHREGLTVDCLILDECHRVSPEKQSSQVMNMGARHILGLSATPEGSVVVLGQPFFTVDWEEANLCPFTVHYTTFAPEEYESKAYNEWTKKMQKVASDYTSGQATNLPPNRNKRYDQLVRLRRDCCYTFDSRIKHAINLIKPYAKAGKRIIVFAERNEQLRKMYEILLKDGIQCSVCSQWMDTLKDFEEHRTNVLLLCKRLREGWNDVTLEIEILVAPTTRELSHTQVVGRVQRQDPNNPDKHAHIICLLAEGTSDMSLTRKNDFPRSSVETIGIEKMVSKANMSQATLE